jgi:cytochrome bd-type quinol oxidase subunit 2
MNITSMLQNQTSQTFAIVSLPVVIAVLVVLGLASMIMLWRRNKTAEAISLLNTVLLIIIIILLMFPPNA